MPHTLHVISHTHWDREWYLTFQQFRLRLVDLIDHVLEILEADPSFRYFNLDAQTIVLEDYLQIRPQARPRLEKLVREGRLTVGPWYQLNDEFLTSGEATVRSLLVGHRIAEAFGGSLKIGYLPDQFGNLSQMPQILRGFGIDNAIVGRGYQMVGDRKMEFWWEGPDGSRVLASLMAFWYNNAQRFPSDTGEAVKYAERLRDTMSPRSFISHLLLMNGVDHLEAQPDVGRIIEAVNAEWERQGVGDRLVHSTLTQYIDALQADVEAKQPPLEVKVGELREDRNGACLAGTLSSRMYLKQANHHAQITLEQYTERLSAFARITGAAYPYDQLLYAWKLLMQNHPHDSICGCSIDQVHREMLPRFEQVEQVGQELTDRALSALTGRDVTKGATADALSLVVFNTLNWTRTDPVITTLEFPLGIPTRGNPPRDDTKMVKGFRLTDPDGNEVPFAVTHMGAEIRAVLNPHALNLDQWVQRVTVEFVAEAVPACGYKAYTITTQGEMPAYPVQSMDVLSTSHAHPYLEDIGEVGDEYLHRRPTNDTTCVFDTHHVTGRNYQTNAVRGTEMDEADWPLPAAATSDRQGRTAEQVVCPTKTWATKWVGVDRIEHRVTFDNRARDHRLIARVESVHLDDVEQCIFEGQFDAVERPLKDPLEAEGALPLRPQQFWTAITGKVGGRDGEEPWTLTLSNRGLPEIDQTLQTNWAPHITLTLLRCVGQLSARGDGPGISTPDAQCLGKHTFEYAISMTKGDWKQGQVWKQAHQFNVPLTAVQCSPDGARPTTRSFVTVEPAELVVTAIKRAEDQDTLILRFFNITDELVPEGRVAMPGAKRLRLVNLNEEPQEEWRVGDRLEFEVGAKKIVTVEFEL
jgi:mannosylglycerate hydrolase